MSSVVTKKKTKQWQQTLGFSSFAPYGENTRRWWQAMNSLLFFIATKKNNDKSNLLSS